MKFDFFTEIYRRALLAVLLQIGTSIFLLLLAAAVFGWSLSIAILLAFIISLSSTAVGLRMLEATGEFHTLVGRTVVGILIAQDVAIVPIIIAVNVLVGADLIDGALILKLSLGGLMVGALIWYLQGSRNVRLPLAQLVLKHRDLAAVSALMGCFAAAAISGMLGLSTALGAFLAGLYLGNTTQGELLREVSEPIEGVFMMVFFVAIGLLLDIEFIGRHITYVVSLLAVVFIASSLVNYFVLRTLDSRWREALVASFALGQIGEFSFVLSEIGFAHGLLDQKDRSLIVSVIALGLAISPLWNALARRLSRTGEKA